MANRSLTFPSNSDSEALLELNVVFRMGLNPLVSIAGIVTNIINILVFRQMGSSDGITPTFIFLSASDWLICVFNVTKGITLLIWLHTEVHIISCVAFVSFYYTMTVYLIPFHTSAFCTAVISVVRCCAVAMPLQVKNVLTTRRQMFVILLLTLTVTAPIAFNVASLRFTYRATPTPRPSCIVTYELHPHDVLELLRVVLTYGPMLVVLVSLIILAVHLKRSSEFQRQQSAAAPTSSTKPGMEESDKKKRSATRERQVMKVATFVAAIFIASNVPWFIILVLRHALPGFNETGSLKYSHQANLLLAELLVSVNASVNIIVYLRSYSRYRMAFDQLFIGSQGSA